MAYPSRFLRLVASGPLYSIESWSFSLSLIPDFPGPDEDAAPTEVPTGVVDAVRSFISYPSICSDRVQLSTVKLNEIGPDGRYTNKGDTVLHEYTPLVNGVSSGIRLPAQVSLAVSLQTARKRGRAHAGRFYLPGPAAALDTSGLTSNSYADEVLSAATMLVNSLNQAVPGYRVGVASSVGAGDFEPVTNLRVGRVLDTIRSRRTSLPETYVVGPALAPT